LQIAIQQLDIQLHGGTAKLLVELILARQSGVVAIEV